MSLINERGYNFFHPNKFQEKFFVAKREKEILLTIDDAFSSFYNNAWPYLKKNKIPFILFVSTEHIGKTGYMTPGALPRRRQMSMNLSSRTLGLLIGQRADVPRRDISFGFGRSTKEGRDTKKRDLERRV